MKMFVTYEFSKNSNFKRIYSTHNIKIYCDFVFPIFFKLYNMNNL